MTRPIHLVVSTDSKFKSTVLEAAIASRHGLRVATSGSEALHSMADGFKDIALAIIDLDSIGDWRLLVEAITRFQADFPIVAATVHDIHLPDVQAFAFEVVTKALTADEIEKILRRHENEAGHLTLALPA